MISKYAQLVAALAIGTLVSTAAGQTHLSEGFSPPNKSPYLLFGAPAQPKITTSWEDVDGDGELELIIQVGTPVPGESRPGHQIDTDGDGDVDILVFVWSFSRRIE